MNLTYRETITDITKSKLTSDNIIFLMLVGAILLPYFRVASSIPAVRFELIVLVVATILLVVTKTVKIQLNGTLFFYFGLNIIVSALFAAVIYRFPPLIRDTFELLKLGQYVLTFALAASLTVSTVKLQKYYYVIIVFFLISSFFGFAQFLNLFNINSIITPLYVSDGQMTGLLTYQRITGTTGNPNEFAALLIIPAVLSLSGMIIIQERKKKIFLGISLVIFALATTMTLSRTGMISLMISCMFILFYKIPSAIGFKKLYKTYKWMIPLLLLAVLLVIVFSPDHFIPRMMRVLDLSEDGSWRMRLYNWRILIDDWKLSPVLGWGPGKSINSTISDNEWLQILRRYGLVGLTIFTLCFADLYRKMSRTIKNRVLHDYHLVLVISIQAVMIGYGVYMLAAGVFYSLQIMPLLMLLIGLALNRSLIEKEGS